MPKRISDAARAEIEAVLRNEPAGLAAGEIAAKLETRIPLRTLQYRLKRLADVKRITKKGAGRWSKYFVASFPAAANAGVGRALAKGEQGWVFPPSESGAETQALVRRPIEVRPPVGYNRDFLDSYSPNICFYLSVEDRKRLAEINVRSPAAQAAGTYARQILDRLLIDLSWNSSRLEGNTYSLLDTTRLIELGEAVEGRSRLEAQMILNHKEAIEFLVGEADQTSFDRRTILNLHAFLANNLLPDQRAAGRLRKHAVAIEKSTFQPLAIPQLIEECFDRLLQKASLIEDPFEQSFFILAQLPYLQPFDDVNKRVSRLACNIPFIKQNLSPLSFTDVPRSLYTDALLGVYELNRTDLLRDVFVWAYERSAARLSAIRQSLGEPDPFRLRHQGALRQIVGEIVRGRMDVGTASGRLVSWTDDNIAPEERDRFMEMAELELLGLHEGNFARHQIGPDEFLAWRDIWKRR